MSKLKIKIVEMFAGVGGFHLGLSRASKQYEVVWANQFEPSKKNQFAFNIYKKNFPETPISNEDITKLDTEQIPEMDLLVAGFPCQDYSVATSGAKGIKGKKGVLWWEIHKVIILREPRYILLENVDRLLTSPGVSSKQPGRDFGIILRTLSDLGYGVSWKMINAADYGYPQRRRRTFIFAFKKGSNFNDYVSKIINEEEKIREFITNMTPFSNTMLNKSIYDVKSIDLNSIQSVNEFSNTFSIKKGFRKTGFMIDGKAFMTDYIPKTRMETTLGDLLIPNLENKELYLTPEKIEKFKKLKRGFHDVKISRTGHQYKYGMGSMQFPDSPYKPARTMVTSEATVSRMSHVVRDPGNNRLRLISPLEAERINTFPDRWTELDGVTNSNRYFTMGNALVVDLIKEIGEGILAIISKDKS
ncbi:DNA (cytosine-5)-methyltransferase 1 [[Eubacterium] yurii]|jgi:DNA (cytosine-5-)-methyltransferase|nr:DNA (cytosine-5)-methyltransferase 1 [[Eubacterium] yurii]